MLMVLNHLHVGRAAVCPRLVEGRPPSTAQTDVVRRMLRLAVRLVRPAVAGCGPKLGDVLAYLAAVDPGGERGAEEDEVYQEGDAQPGMGSSTAVPVVASRLWRTSTAPAFDAALHLPGFELATYLDPALLRHPGAPTGKPQPPPARQTGARAEVLDLLQRWDRSGRLRLFPADQVKLGDGIRIQAVAKDEEKDRLICNRQRQNRHE